MLKQVHTHTHTYTQVSHAEITNVHMSGAGVSGSLARPSTKYTHNSGRDSGIDSLEPYLSLSLSRARARAGSLDSLKRI